MVLWKHGFARSRGEGGGTSEGPGETRDHCRGHENRNPVHGDLHISYEIREQEKKEGSVGRALLNTVVEMPATYVSCVLDNYLKEGKERPRSKKEYRELLG